MVVQTYADVVPAQCPVSMVSRIAVFGVVYNSDQQVTVHEEIHGVRWLRSVADLSLKEAVWIVRGIYPIRARVTLWHEVQAIKDHYNSSDLCPEYYSLQFIGWRYE